MRVIDNSVTLQDGLYKPISLEPGRFPEALQQHAAGPSKEAACLCAAGSCPAAGVLPRPPGSFQEVAVRHAAHAVLSAQVPFFCSILTPLHPVCFTNPLTALGRSGKYECCWDVSTPT